MMNYISAFALGLAALVSASDGAVAQARNMCAARDVVLEKLTQQYGETRRSMGLAANNGIVELHASGATGSWTITVTHPNGLTCLVAAGTSFETVDEELPASLGAPT
ncbi:hypothetical protein [Litoreibacter janthinus]|uniref:Peptidase propeptide and YPEB domain-containing protein n=1 Tax=Litoreibacter janthinus TaxID=670154 RepID=A0A1I6GF90_9RHOB|nr:hypothetical protein [Litoreibacter janthinus]SFR40781.1 hypothetical protein SAMN04488002_1371 [Litoreibacter janthinus]